MHGRLGIALVQAEVQRASLLASDPNEICCGSTFLWISRLHTPFDLYAMVEHSILKKISRQIVLVAGDEVDSHELGSFVGQSGWSGTRTIAAR